MDDELWTVFYEENEDHTLRDSWVTQQERLGPWMTSWSKIFANQDWMDFYMREKKNYHLDELTVFLVQ